MSRRALFLSPHLDDVAFSCGGTLIRLVDAGWQVALCTVFTASVKNPQGFALACQLDKGLPSDVDYMALRRAEDLEFARRTGVSDVQHWNYHEAPHRGYESAAALFAGMREDDSVWRDIADELHRPADYLFAPQGLGNHVDHLQVIQAITASGLAPSTIWYRDTPYAIRNPAAQPSALLPAGLERHAFQVDDARKIEGCRAYRSQVPFQFGSENALQAQLDGYAEVFLTASNTDLSFLV